MMLMMVIMIEQWMNEWMNEKGNERTIIIKIREADRQTKKRRIKKEKNCLI